jgi:hypothetical protein
MKTARHQTRAFPRGGANRPPGERRRTRDGGLKRIDLGRGRRRGKGHWLNFSSYSRKRERERERDLHFSCAGSRARTGRTGASGRAGGRGQAVGAAAEPAELELACTVFPSPPTFNLGIRTPGQSQAILRTSGISIVRSLRFTPRPEPS